MNLGDSGGMEGWAAGLVSCRAFGARKQVFV